MNSKKLIAAATILMIAIAPTLPAKAQLGSIETDSFGGSDILDGAVDGFGLSENIFGGGGSLSIGNILSLGSTLGGALDIPGIGNLSSLGSFSELAGIDLGGLGGSGLSAENLELANKASSLFTDFYKGIKSNDILGSVIKGGQGILGIINPQEASQSILADGSEAVGGRDGNSSTGKTPSVAEAETPEQVLWIYRASENVGSQGRGSYSNSVLGPEGQKVISNQIKQSALNSDTSQKALEAIAGLGESSVNVSDGIADLATKSKELAITGKKEKSSQAVLKKLLESNALAANQQAGAAVLSTIGVVSQVQSAKQARAAQAELTRVNEQLLNLQFVSAANLDATNKAVFTAENQLANEHNKDAMGISYAGQTTGSWLIPGMEGQQ